MGFRFNRIYRVLGLLGLAKSRDKAFTFKKGDLIIKLPSWAALCSIYIWVVVKIRVPFWVSFRVLKKGP